MSKIPYPYHVTIYLHPQMNISYDTDKENAERMANVFNDSGFFSKKKKCVTINGNNTNKTQIVPIDKIISIEIEERK